MRIAPAGWMLLVVAAACRERADAARAPASDSTPTTPTASADTLTLAERRAAGGRIVFLSERGGAPQVWAISSAGDGERRLSDGRGAVYPAAVAPDGRSVLAVAVREEGGEHGEQMLLLPVDGGPARPLGPASARARSPSWAPDGRWLVFESDRESFRDLYSIGADGRGLRRLTVSREGNFDPAVAPDGRMIAFASSRDGDAEVYTMREDGTTRRLTAFHRDDWGPRWSPDGRTIAFLSNREGADRIFLVAADGTGLRKLNGRAAADTVGQDADLAWSPDGTRIAHTLYLRPGVSRVRIVDVRTGAAREVPGVTGAAQPAWSPDGRFLVFGAQAGGDTELWVARGDGTAPTRLTHARGADWLPRWSR